MYIGKTGYSQSQLSVPAQLVKEISLPGMDNDFLRPTQVFIDNRSNELYIIDTGNSRILIFDSNGTFRYEFYGMDKFGMAYDVATDSHGFIYILGSTKNGVKLFKFDYDGTFIKEVELKGYKKSTFFTSLEIDNQDNLVLYNRDTKDIVTFDRVGNKQKSFTALEEVDQLALRELVVNSITVKNDLIYIPVGNIGNVYIYNLDGTFVHKFGIQGTTLGQMNFPVAVNVTDNNLIMVLDKLRFNVVCFDYQGRFLGEFGGKGYRAGWFYHPSYMAVTHSNHVVISQIFDNRVQICEIPQFILDKAADSFKNRTSSEKSSSSVNIPDNLEFSISQYNNNNKTNYTTSPTLGEQLILWRY